MDHDIYRKKLLLSAVVPLILVVLIWLAKFIELLFGIDFSGGGIHPLSADGLPGIFLSPFIHSDLKHLFNNTLPLFLLSVALFYFYSDSAIAILGWIYLLTGVLVWIAGRQAWHIGASGLVYGLASFLFFSGIIRRHIRMMALSMLIVFSYGSMVWGIFPDVYEDVSWESHMLGFISGAGLAVIYRKEGPLLPVHEWLDEEDEAEEKDENEQQEIPGDRSDTVNGKIP